jgi:hypothetical protein
MKHIVIKRFICAAVLAAALGGCDQPGGSLSPETIPGLVALQSASDFEKIGKSAEYPLSGEYQLPAGSREIKLTEWEPIGTQAAPFTGKISGNGRTVIIEGFAESALNGNYLGLFGYVQGADIRDLTVTLNTAIDLDGDEKYVGVLAGYSKGAALRNITAMGNLNVQKTGTGRLYAGGITGYADSATIADSASVVSITGGSQSDSYAGGLAAYAQGGTVTKSTALGNITITISGSSSAYAGGLIGFIEGGTTMDSTYYATGTIQAAGYNVYAGGIAGRVNSAVIRESYSSGTVLAKGTSPFAGGIAAYLGGGSIRNGYSIASVTAQSVTNRALAGGIVGAVCNDAEISAVYTMNAITAVINGTVPGPSIPAPPGASAGGIAGALYGAATVKNSIVLAEGAVSSSGGSPLNAYRIGFAAAPSTVLENNKAYHEFSVTGGSGTDTEQDGADIDQAKPARIVYEDALGWDFGSIWRMSAGGYPVLTGQSVNAGDYIEITSAAQLAQIGMNNNYPLNAAYRIPAGTANITVSDWSPIGTEEEPFTGSFTGNGSTVITINGFSPTALSGGYIGLFGNVRGSVRQKAEFKDIKVTVTSTADLASTKAEYAGGLAAYTEETTIEDSSVSGTMKWTKTASYPLYSGGMSGFMKNGKIHNSNSTAVVESEGRSGVYSGGILGYASGTITVSGCDSSGNVIVKAGSHNSSAGGIVGYILGTNDSTVTSCTASGNISLTPATGREESLLMFYCGGVVGYAGNGTADMGDTARSGALIEKSRYTGGTVYCENAYPYAGGVIGYNYTGSEVKQSSASGTVTAKGSRLPYAGGVAGYISGAAKVENCYATAAVNATATSKQALAGGVAGATAKPSLLSKCYATGAVTATIDGSGTTDMGGSLGVPSAANAGGISGSLYYANPRVEKSAALNSAVKGIDTGSGGDFKVYRIGGVSSIDGGTPELSNNIAWQDMPVTGGTVTDKGEEGQDGADYAAQPVQSDFVELGWDFDTIWEMEGGYPTLR